MLPVVEFLSLGGRPVGTYGLFVALGVFSFALLILRGAKRRGLDLGKVLAILAFGFLGALIGAHGLFVIVRGLGGVCDLWSGGFVFYGGFFGGLTFASLLARRERISALELADISVVGLLVGHALGRVGCFLGGCCFGAPTGVPFGVSYPEQAGLGEVLRHPVPLYEAMMLLVLAIGFAAWPLQNVGNGRRFLTYVVFYAAVRFCLEFFRGDSIRGIGPLGLSTSQWIASLTILAASFLILRAVGIGSKGTLRGPLDSAPPSVYE